MESKIDEAKLFQELLGDIQYKHKKYNVEFKLKIVNLIEAGISLHSISDKLKIYRKILRDWRDKKDSLLEVKNKNNKFRCYRENTEKKTFSAEQEETIRNWIISIRSKHIPLSTKSLVCFAGKINDSFEKKLIILN